uniref:WW domain-containing protein n=1 Tax=Phaeomonas parva TaxID=124430 RepID=A0A7S1TZ63_9STRA|mmetsp:Transcript_24634/g.77217  ORF Transcript_24634/g.77217 Transcript_24634/m.77217 type:complete len:918 (+) Transcript_24634:167-2920(+)
MEVAPQDGSGILAIADSLEQRYQANLEEVNELRELIRERQLAAIRDLETGRSRSRDPSAWSAAPANVRSDSVAATVQAWEDIVAASRDNIIGEEAPGAGGEAVLWHRVFSSDHNAYYYANLKTRETTWVKPTSGAIKTLSGLEDDIVCLGDEDEVETLATPNTDMESPVEERQAFPKADGQGQEPASPSSAPSVSTLSMRSEGARASARKALARSRPGTARSTPTSPSSPRTMPRREKKQRPASRLGIEGSRRKQPGKQSKKDDSDVEDSEAAAAAAAAKALRKEKVDERALKHVDAMLKRAEEQRRKLEERRRLQEQKEASMLKAPVINRRSRKIASQYGTQKSIGDRAQELLEKKKEKQDRIREERNAQLAKAAPGRPKINDKSRRVAGSRRLDDMMKWKNDMEQKRKERAEALQKEEAKSLTYTPKLTAGTKRIVRQIRQADPDNPDSSARSAHDYDMNDKVEDRLISSAATKHVKLERMREEEEKRIRMQARPQVDPHSANLRREGDVVDRLYNIAAEKKFQKMVEDDINHLMPMLDPATKQPLFRPQINETSKVMARSRQQQLTREPHETRVPKSRFHYYHYGAPHVAEQPQRPAVEDRLLRQGAKYERERQQRAEAAEARDRNLVKVSKINEKSKHIVREMETYTGSKSKRRLLKPTGNVRPGVVESIEQPTFQPTLYPSEYRNRRRSFDAYTARSSSGDYEDSFRSSSPAPAATRVADTTLYERNKRWAEQRSRRIEKTKQDLAKMEKQVCTFAPKLKAPRGRGGYDFYAGADSDPDGYAYYQESATLAERSRNWLERRNEKVAIAQRSARERELDGYTFQPELRAGARNRSGSRDTSARRRSFSGPSAYPAAQEVDEPFLGDYGLHDASFAAGGGGESSYGSLSYLDSLIDESNPGLNPLPLQRVLCQN